MQDKAALCQRTPKSLPSSFRSSFGGRTTTISISIPLLDLDLPQKTD
jgi:hypothetical protein